jgi:hypothetical protein
MNYKIGNIPEKMKSAFIDDSYYPSRSFTVEIERSRDPKLRPPMLRQNASF